LVGWGRSQQKKSAFTVYCVHLRVLVIGD